MVDAASLSHHRLRACGAALITLPGVVAGYGLVDLAHRVPGPRIWLALPLQETGHSDGVSVAALVVVWCLVFSLVALLSPRSGLGARALATGRAGFTFALLFAVQALCLHLVRQTSFGFEWKAAAWSPSVYIAAACAYGATRVCAPTALARAARRSVARRAPVRATTGAVKESTTGSPRRKI